MRLLSTLFLSSYLHQDTLGFLPIHIEPCRIRHSGRRGAQEKNAELRF